MHLCIKTHLQLAFNPVWSVAENLVAWLFKVVPRVPSVWINKRQETEDVHIDIKQNVEPLERELLLLWRNTTAVTWREFNWYLACLQSHQMWVLNVFTAKCSRCSTELWSESAFWDYTNEENVFIPSLTRWRSLSLARIQIWNWNMTSYVLNLQQEFVIKLISFEEWGADPSSPRLLFCPGNTLFDLVFSLRRGSLRA